MPSLKRFLWKVRLSLMGNFLKTFDEYARLQWLDKEEINALQQERLTRLLSHAYHHVPYYREVLLNAGVIQNGQSVNLQNLSRIPLLDKSIIRTNYEKLKSDDLSARKWYENTSGGSTGEPVRFVQDLDSSNALNPVVILQDSWSQYSICERRVILWGSERDLFVGKETFKIRLGRRLRNEIWLNAFRITPEQMFSYIKCINDFKPVQILAYVASIYELSRFIEREKLSIYSPGSIMVSAGVLHEHMRETIERVFNAPVFNRYGSREVGPIACECDHHQGLHSSQLSHHVEILRKDGSPAAPGELGEIVVTLLTNYAMPLIRYRIGDIGVWSEKPCTCGRSWPLLKYVSGKMWDIFTTKEGTQAHGEIFIRIFYFQNWIKKFQVIQEDFDFIRVLIMPNGKAGEIQKMYAKEIDMITGKIRFVMGEDCRVQFEFVNDIDPTASGKYHYIISKVS
jgi:phenylacetate-CoA ligase